jgi:hypothetical protein
MARHHQARVIGIACAEKNFVLGIILDKKTIELLFEAGLAAVQRLEERKRRRKAGLLGEFGKRFVSFVEEAWNRPKHDAGKYGRSDEAENGNAGENVEHAGLKNKRLDDESATQQLSRSPHPLTPAGIQSRQQPLRRQAIRDAG